MQDTQILEQKEEIARLEFELKELKGSKVFNLILVHFLTD